MPANGAMRKKVLCTLGPTSMDRQVIKRMEEIGVDLFRLNLSHVPIGQIEEMLLFLQSNSNVPVCLDTQGAQVRTGTFKDNQLTLESGSEIKLVASPAQGGEGEVPIYPGSVLSQLEVGDLLSVDSSAIPLQIIEVGSTYRARVLSGGTIGSNKAVSIDRSVRLSELTCIDRTAIDIGLRLGIKYVALSFANRQADIELLRGLVGDDVEIIAKIESRSGVENLQGILGVTDAILIDRGDLSREIPLEGLPFIQKDIIRQCNAAQVPVYVATNLLETMVTAPHPTRAEANDVINTLLDGADGLVLAAETAIGKYPVACVSMIKGLIHQFERQQESPWPASDFVPYSPLIAPHGGTLVHRVLNSYELDAVAELPRLDVSDEVILDVRQIAVGAFSPLEGFMGREALESVLAKHVMPDGTTWPIPILLQLNSQQSPPSSPGSSLALANDGQIQALLHVEEYFNYDLDNLALRWFGTTDTEHPGVRQLLNGSNQFVAGKIDLLGEALNRRQPYELTPTQARMAFQHRHWQTVVGFHTRNVPHRAHEYLQFAALNQHTCDGIFIHPVTGPKKSGDFSGPIILESYQLLIDRFYPENQALLGGFATYSRYAGPREAVFTAICRQNFGCSHFIVGRDHTGVGAFYPPDASARLFGEIGDVGIRPVFFDEVSYCESCDAHVERCSHEPGFSQQISGTQVRQLLMRGDELPEWFMRQPISRLIIDGIKNGNEVFVP